ncbi:TPA: hypothetical protein DIC40_05275 [Patescibacteria group bacterium]|nr:hypothetical protein [Candidatus Gracilibacteria bacterium]
MDLPGKPGFALKIFLNLYANKVFSSFDALKIIDHPFPPFPPAGHPKATHFSLLHVEIPSHPFPDCTVILTSS